MEAVLSAIQVKAEHGGVAAGERWLDVGGNWVETLNPSSGALLALVRMAGDEDYALMRPVVMDAAVRWRTVPAPKRGALIATLGRLLRQHKVELGELIALEMGKARVEGLGEVQEMIDMADFAVGQSRMLYGLTMPSERPAHQLYEQWLPLGCVGVVTAFNFPMAVWAWNAMLAVICGDVVIWKPSEKTPLCAIAVHQLCIEAMRQHEAPAVFSLYLTDDVACVRQLIDDPAVPLISFTGSTAVGRDVAVRVASRLGRYLLELGGNNAMIIDASANIDLAVPAALFSAIGTSGQRCTTCRRLLVHRSLYAAVVARLQAAYQQVKVGSPLDPDNHMGPLISAAAQQQFVQTCEELRALGAEFLVGGQVIEGDGFFVEPTLVVADPSWDILQEERFVPILYVMPFDELTQAVQWQNDVPQGLSSALFTQQIASQALFLSTDGSDCGLAGINVGTSGAEIGGAFGGEKDTGGGREAGSDSWKQYMRRQTVTVNGGDALPLSQGIEFNLG